MVKAANRQKMGGLIVYHIIGSYYFVDGPETRICLTWVTFSKRLFIMHPNQPGSHDFCTSRPLSLSSFPVTVGALSKFSNCLLIIVVVVVAD